MNFSSFPLPNQYTCSFPPFLYCFHLIIFFSLHLFQHFFCISSIPSSVRIFFLFNLSRLLVPSFFHLLCSFFAHSFISFFLLSICLIPCVLLPSFIPLFVYFFLDLLLAFLRSLAHPLSVLINHFALPPYHPPIIFSFFTWACRAR